MLPRIVIKMCFKQKNMSSKNRLERGSNASYDINLKMTLGTHFVCDHLIPLWIQVDFDNWSNKTE